MQGHNMPCLLLVPCLPYNDPLPKDATTTEEWVVNRPNKALVKNTTLTNSSK